MPRLPAPAQGFQQPAELATRTDRHRPTRFGRRWQPI